MGPDPSPMDDRGIFFVALTFPASMTDREGREVGLGAGRLRFSCERSGLSDQATKPVDRKAVANRRRNMM
ncbi:hypothetical protein GCM10027098_06780 [Bowmanella dokdonensis]